MELQSKLHDGNTLTLRIDGRFDAHTTGQVKTIWVTNEAIKNVVLDLSGATFIDSMALATIVGGLKTMRQRGGTFVLSSPSEPVQVILELTNMNRVFSIATSLEAGLAALGS